MPILTSGRRVFGATLLAFAVVCSTAACGSFIFASTLDGGGRLRPITLGIYRYISNNNQEWNAIMATTGPGLGPGLGAADRRAAVRRRRRDHRRGQGLTWLPRPSDLDRPALPHTFAVPSRSRTRVRPPQKASPE